MKRLFAVVILMIFLTSCGMSGSVYSKVRNNDRLTIKAELLNSELSEVYNLSAGDEVEVKLSVRSGEFRIVIGSGDEKVYEGNGGGLTEFSVTIKEGGEYTISVDGKDGKGELDFDVIRSK